MKIVKILMSLLVLISSSGCTKEVDFNQVDDISIQTSFISTLFYLDFYSKDFLNTTNQEIHFQSDVVIASINDGMKDYLEKIEFNIVSKNTFNRGFILQIVCFDASEQPIYVFNPDIVIPPNSDSVTTKITIPNNEIDVLYRTAFFGFIMVLNPSLTGDVINLSDDFNLNIKSSAILYFNYKKI